MGTQVRASLRNKKAARVTLDFTLLGSLNRRTIAWPKDTLGRAKPTRTVQRADLRTLGFQARGMDAVRDVRPLHGPGGLGAPQSVFRPSNSSSVQ